MLLLVSFWIYIPTVYLNGNLPNDSAFCTEMAKLCAFKFKFMAQL